jgi:hypothetical protein
MSLPAIDLLLKKSKKIIIIVFKSSIEITLFKESTTFRNNKSRFILLQKNNLYSLIFKYFVINTVYFFGNSIKTISLLKTFFPFKQFKQAHPYIYKIESDSNCIYNQKRIHKSLLYCKLIDNNYNYSVKKLFFTTTNCKRFSFQKKKYIVIAPGSGILESHKRWSTEGYSKLVNYLLDFTTYDIVFLGSTADQNIISDVVKDIDKSYSSRMHDLSCRTTFKDLFSIFYLADLVVGTDNGLLHIANVFDIKIFAIFGPTNPYITGPNGDNVYFYNLNLTCSPCYQKDNIILGCGNNVCLKNISYHNVINTFLYNYSFLFNE